MNINPNAIVFWALGACIGWLIGDTTGAVTGLAVTLGLSWIVSQ